MPKLMRQIASVFVRPFSPAGRLSMLILFVTSRCNQKCKSCFFWERRNGPADDLRLDEIEQVSSSLPSFDVLLLSGGEPFLREDLADVIRLFVTNNRIRSVAIPTNGMATDLTVEKVRKIAGLAAGLHVSVNFSLDGTAEVHDGIRGVPGAFEKTMATMRAVAAMKTEFPGLTWVVNTVVMADNVSDILGLIAGVEKEGIVTDHAFEIIRGDPAEKGQKKLDRAAVGDLYGNIVAYQERIASRKFAFGGLKGFVAKTLYIANLRTLYGMQLANYFDGRKWGFPCGAGGSVRVLYSNGDVPLCELRSDAVLNVRANGYDMERIARDPGFRCAVAGIRASCCSCTHVCFLMDGAYRSPRFLFLRYPFHVLRAAVGRIV
jgi:MoaA/NifB/PqqE/SkfB family radical SAM enzyme